MQTSQVYAEISIKYLSACSLTFTVNLFKTSEVLCLEA